MRLPVEDRHEVFALCSYVFFDLNAEIAAVFRYTIEPIEQHPLIFGASDRIWIDLILDVRSPLRRVHDYVIFLKIML